MGKIKIIGELDLKREQDRRIYEPSGLAPTLRAENHEVKILVGIIQNMDEVRVLGQMDNTLDGTFESANRVYDSEGVCPTIPTCTGGGFNRRFWKLKM